MAVSEQQGCPTTPRMASPRSSPTCTTTAAAAATATSVPLSATTNYTYLRSPSGSVLSTALEGYLLKRGSHISSYVRWNDRYFILRPTEGTLSYYLNRGDVKPKGVIVLSRECTVSEVYMAERREKKSADRTAAGGVGGSGSSAVSLGDEHNDDSERSISERDNDEVAMTELAAREKQPVTKRLASAVYGSSSGGSSGGSGGIGSSGTSSGKSKSKKGREKLYCVKVSWLRSATFKSSAVERIDGPSSTDDDGVPEIPNVMSGGGSADGYDYQSATRSSSSAQGAAAPLLAPRASPSRSSSSVSSGGLRGTNFLPDSFTSSSERSAVSMQGTPSGGGGGGSSTSKKSTSPFPSIPRPYVGLSRSKSADNDDNASSSGRQSPARPSRISRDRRVASEAVGDRNRTVDSASDSALNYSLPPRSALLPSQDGAAGSTSDVPLLPSVASLDGADTPVTGVAALNAYAESGIAKHYQTQVALQKYQTEEEHQKSMQLMYLSAKRAAHKRNKKRFVQGSKIAAAAAAVTTASVLTAGVGLAIIGLVFVGLTAAAGGSGFVAEAGYKRSKDSTSLVIAAPTLEEAQAWRDAILAAIAAQGGDGGAPAAASAATLDADPRMVRSPANSPRSAGIEDVGITPKHGERINLENHGPQVPTSFETQWVPVDTSPSLLGIGGGFSSTGGMRIFREEPISSTGTTRSDRVMYRQRKSMLAVVGSEGQYACLPLKASVVLPSSPLDAFMCLMSHSRIEDPHQVPLVPNSGQRASFRIVETIDDHCDIVHLIHRPLYLFPSWTAPRDYCLFRYWRFEADGTYMICYDSVEHRECPPMPGYVRGSLYGVHTIAPRRRHRRGGARAVGVDDEECLLTHHVQVDPKGWVPKASPSSSFPANILRTFAGGMSSGYVEAFGISALLCSLDVKDALHNDRFVQVSMDSNQRSSRSSWKRSRSFTVLGATIAHDTSTGKPSGGTLGIGDTDFANEEDDAVISDYRFVEREVIGPEEISHDESKVVSWATDPQPCVLWAWAAPDANSFLTRGKKYLSDRKKYNAGDSVFRLFAVDMVEVDGTIYSGMCAHPNERVQRALRREQQGLPSDLPPFVVAINIAVAGPPWYHMVFYYAVDDKSLIDGTNGTPFSKLANEFFFGDSDEMRDETFKMIPRIVEGNFIVRKAVGSTPAIMGNKLKQHYIHNDRYFELLLDTGSSSVAAGVIRLVLGYSKTVVVDMAFLLEGKDESTLPEKIFGAVRLKHYVFGKKLTRFLEAP
eukprot:CAMPEP_0178520734 /NCGR_PEP_ID=MMETSP0696-20121128/27567_1 /TAXON_ID=265572 /ORGANISM="Extubocellulus spinifer, Strain CCMP396" /LENGTH=1252 /DNA_ID=CAMNT_0020151621 /DNA_START=173 /DNA_END=3932 /DNA_ORIENTATION=-